MTWLDPNNKEIETLCGLPYRRDYVSLGSEDDTADETEYRIVFREGDEVCIRGQMDLLPHDAALFSRAVEQATDDALAWFKAETKWQQINRNKLSPDMELTCRMTKVEFSFDGIPDGKGNLKDYTVALCGNRGNFAAFVDVDEESHKYDLTGVKVDFSAETAERIMRRHLFETDRMEGCRAEK